MIDGLPKVTKRVTPQLVSKVQVRDYTTHFKQVVISPVH